MSAQTMEIDGCGGAGHSRPGVHDEIGTCMVVRMSGGNPSPLPLFLTLKRKKVVCSMEILLSPILWENSASEPWY